MRRRDLLLVGIAVFLWCLPGIAVRSTFGAHVAVDEPQYLLSAISLGEDLDLDISDELRSQRWRAFHESRLPTQTAVLEDGRRVSPHDPLLPALLAVPMLIGGWVGAKVALAAMAGALAAAMAWVATARLGIDRRRAQVGAACFSAAAPLAVYGTQVYPELPAGLALVLGVGAVLGPLRSWSVLVVGLAVSALPWLSVKYAPVAATLAGVALWRLWRKGDRRGVVSLAGGLAVSGFLFAAGHLAIYGGLTPYAVGDHFVGDELDVVGTDPNYPARGRRALGLLVDRDFGLAAWQPAWLLLLPALGAALRRRPAWLLPIGLPLLAGWLVATFVALTMHGYWWPGRQTVVVLPLAALLVTWWASTRWLVIGTVAGALTWLWLLWAGLRERLTWVVDFERGGGPLRRLLRPLLPDLRAWQEGDWLGLAAWLGVATAALGAGWVSGGRGGRHPDEDAVRGEGADADDAIVEAHGGGAVG